jgi:acyl-coenzyme A synthetase/AMP-(fatty) acid ligase
MGYRIELEEIEAALAQAPGVAECAVVYQRSGEGLGRIVAFAAAQAGAAADAVRDAATRTLAERLPAYMQPRLLTVLPALPKNANGKIDRVALLLSLGT